MKAAREDLHRTVSARLQAAGQRYTPSRQALVDALAGAERPIALPEILERERSLPHSSAYRNLAVLEDARVVRRVLTTGEFARFELAEDLSEHHHHLVCSNCGKVTDFEPPPHLEATMRRTIAAISDATDFTAQGHRLDLVGLCADCA